MSRLRTSPRRAFRRLRARIRDKISGPSRGVVLLYHRVSDIACDPQLLCVSPRNFAEHLEVIKTLATPAPLSQFANSVPEARDRRQVGVTFDDGYADNYTVARPLLESAGIPATVFVSTANIDSTTEFWWDELERLILLARQLPSKLSIKLASSFFEWESRDPSSSQTALEDLVSWNVLASEALLPQHDLYQRLSAWMRCLPIAERTDALQQLRDWSPQGQTGRGTHRTMTSREIQAIDNGCVTVGAHTVNHPVLSSLSESAQRFEIGASRTRLEEIVGHSVDAFSYPYGTQDDLTADTVQFVSDAGFSHACINQNGPVRSHSDSLKVNRFLVRNWDGDEFARQITKWLLR